MALGVDLSILPAAQRALWPELRALPQGFVLYGGTAIALRLAHRVSVDFDFFATAAFDPLELHRSVGALADGQILHAGPNTLSVLVDRNGEVKVSCFGGIGGRVGVPDKTADDAVRVASALDLLAHKLKVVLQRAEARDYQDIAALLRGGVGLAEGLGAAATLFAPGFPVAESVKALTYFSDVAEPSRLAHRDRDLLVVAVKNLRGAIPDVPLASDDLALSGSP